MTDTPQSARSITEDVIDNLVDAVEDLTATVTRQAEQLDTLQRQVAELEQRG